MKLLGDVSENDKAMAKDLEEQEKYIDMQSLPDEFKAKMCVCLAHDWYALGADEEGNRLLERAESIYPGYFKNLMLKHSSEDVLFSVLIQSLSAYIVDILLYRLKDMGNK